MAGVAWTRAEVGGDEDVDDGQAVGVAASACRRSRSRRPLPRRARRLAQLPGMATIVARSSAGKRPAMKATSGVERRDCRQALRAGERVAQLGDAGGLGAGMDVVGGELADGPFLLDVGEADASRR